VKCLAAVGRLRWSDLWFARSRRMPEDLTGERPVNFLASWSSFARNSDVAKLMLIEVGKRPQGSSMVPPFLEPCTQRHQRIDSKQDDVVVSQRSRRVSTADEVIVVSLRRVIDPECVGELVGAMFDEGVRRTSKVYGHLLSPSSALANVDDQHCA
jgi:hypothetical protein